MSEPYTELWRQIIEWAKGGTPLDSMAEAHLRLMLHDYFESRLEQAAAELREHDPQPQADGILLDIDAILRVASGTLDRGTPEQRLEYIAETCKLVLSGEGREVPHSPYSNLSAEQFWNVWCNDPEAKLDLENVFMFAEQHASNAVGEAERARRQLSPRDKK